MAHKYLVTLTAGEDGYIVAECPALPGCVSQGKTREEALRNIQEAIEGIIEVRKAQKLPIPISSKSASPHRWPRFPSSRAVRQLKHLRKSASSFTAKREATRFCITPTGGISQYPIIKSLTVEPYAL